MTASTHAAVRVMASSPGSIGNVGPGLDVLGCAITGARDEVIAEWCEEPGIVIRDAGHAELSTSSAEHASGIAAAAVMREAVRRGLKLAAPGIAMHVTKGLPLMGGQGGSAASAVAGAAAANALLGEPLDVATLLGCCLEAESRVAGRHLDNLAPALLGGIVLVRSLDPIEAIRLPVPAGLVLVLVHPQQRLSTAESRRSLPASISLGVATHQLAHVAAMVAACYANDLALFGRGLDDRIAEPARAGLLPGFVAAKRAALEAGALGASISGAGPTAFAVVDGLRAAEPVAAAMHAEYARAGVACDTRVCEIDLLGTTVSVL